MRHRRKVNKLGRKAEHREALLSNLAVALIMNKRIKTTVAKAKALRQYIEPLITRAKEDSMHNRRIAFRYLRNKYAVTELFREIAKKVEDRPGGYTRVLKLGFRKGDGAEMALIELVDYNPEYTQNPSALAGEKKRRVRRGGRKKSSTQQVQEQAAAQEQAAGQQTEEQDLQQAEPEKEQTADQQPESQQAGEDQAAQEQAQQESADNAENKDESQQ